MSNKKVDPKMEKCSCGHRRKDHYKSRIKGVAVCGKDNCTGWNRCTIKL